MLIKFNTHSRQIDQLLKKYKAQLNQKDWALEQAKQELIEIFVKECRQAMNDKKIVLEKNKI